MFRSLYMESERGYNLEEPASNLHSDVSMQSSAKRLVNFKNSSSFHSCFNWESLIYQRAPVNILNK
jgi:hypothetical protein